MTRWSRNGTRRMSVLAGLAGVAVLAGVLLPALGHDFMGNSAVCACGLGNTPTILANGEPALLFPVTKNTPASQPVGIFLLQYPARTSIAFTEDLSRVVGAPDPNSLKWRWSFGDGTPTSSEVSPHHTFARPGNYNVHSQIFDPSSNAWTDFDSAQINVIAAAIPNPPIVKLTASRHIVAPGGSITFDTTGSHAADGGSLTYLWNFNDGSTGTGQTITHTFAIQGRGIIAVVATDSHGARTVATLNIAVVSSYPVAKLSASATSVAPNSTVRFDASGSTAPAGVPGDKIETYVWDFGDGSPQVTTQSPAVSHRYTKWGTFTASVKVVDSQGAPDTASVGLTVGPNWRLVTIAIAAVLLIWSIGYLIVHSGRKRKREREREAARELARARRLNGRDPRQRVGARGEMGYRQPMDTPRGGGARHRDDGEQGPRSRRGDNAPGRRDRW